MMGSLSHGVKRVVSYLLIGAIRGWQLVISPLFPHACRYHPTCSEFARQALLQHGLVNGGKLATQRLMRCHPWGGSGVDQVPPKERDPQPDLKDRAGH